MGAKSSKMSQLEETHLETLTKKLQAEADTDLTFEQHVKDSVSHFEQELPQTTPDRKKSD